MTSPASAPRPAGRTRRSGGALRAVAVILAVVVVVALAGVWWLRSQIDPGDPGALRSVTVEEGASTGQIAGTLADAGVITNATIFEYYARLRGAGTFIAGTYELAERSSMGDVLDRLEAGPPAPPVVTITIPEGLWLSDVRQRILDTFEEMHPAELDAALATVRSAYQPEGASLEGLLFPATYEVLRTDAGDEEKLVRQMVAAFDRVAGEVGLAGASKTISGAAGTRVLSPYEILVVASMVEEETAIASERPMVARVIYNRLAKGERLGIDATVLYALGEHKESLSNSDLNVDSPYNTRRYSGLPPGPISAPSRESIEAALSPAEGDWLYYVLVDREGNHHFTADYDEFLRAAQDARDRGVF